jgi:hypothetical protein
MRAILDRLLGALRRFVLLRGAQLTDVAVAFAMTGAFAACLVIAGKLGRSAR